MTDVGAHRSESDQAYVMRIDHVALAVREPRESLRFYQDVLRLDGPVREESYGFVLTAGHVSFTLFSGVPPSSQGEFHIGASFPDADAVRHRRAELLALGASELEWCDEPGYVSMKVVDPDGYVVELSWDEKHSGP